MSTTVDYKEKDTIASGSAVTVQNVLDVEKSPVDATPNLTAYSNEDAKRVLRKIDLALMVNSDGIGIPML